MSKAHGPIGGVNQAGESGNRIIRHDATAFEMAFRIIERFDDFGFSVHLTAVSFRA